MKRLSCYILSAAIISVLHIGCEEEEIGTYSGDTSIYFWWAAKGNFPYDSTGITFAYAPLSVTDSLVAIPVVIQGPAADYARTFSLHVADSTTAIAGTHYSLPEQLTIDADSVSGTVPLLFHRTEDMQTETFLIVLELRENENFKTRMLETDPESSVDPVIRFTRLKIAVNDLLTRPEAWRDNYFGAFSKEKLLLLNEVTGMPLDALNDWSMYAYWDYWKTFMRRWLNEQTAAGNTVYEEDGTPMYIPL